MATIPIVDLENLKNCENVGSPDWVSAAEKVRNGLGSVGFLYLINHGIPDKVISGMFEQSREFFKLPTSVKQKYQKFANSSKDISIENYYGYSGPGGETLHPETNYEIKETFDWLGERGPGAYPSEEMPTLEPTIIQFDRECKLFIKKMLTLLAIGLKLDVDFFVKCVRHYEEPEGVKGFENVRLVHYPPIEDTFQRPGSVRCGEHSDYGMLTLLFQDQVGGLELQTVDGEWIEAKPIPGSVLVNTGDLTEFWTGGIFPATRHRVVLPDGSDERRKKSRYSLVFFNGPDYASVVAPLDLEKRPCERERLQKSGKVYGTDPIGGIDYMLGRLATQFGY